MSSEQLSQFLKCLRHLGNNPDPNELKHQYLTLSKAYKTSQDRIIDLEHSLIEETLLNERQNSLIELLKQSLTGQMDDPSIIKFIRNLGEELRTEPSLIKTMEQISEILEQRSRKQQIIKQSRLAQMGLRCEELEMSVIQLMDKVKDLQFQLQQSSNQNTNLKQQLISHQHTVSSIKNQNGHLVIQNRALTLQIRELQVQKKHLVKQIQRSQQKIQEQRNTAKQSVDSINMLQQYCKESEKLSKQLSQKLKSEAKTLEELEQILGKDRSQMKNKLQKLVKNYKYLKNKNTKIKQAKVTSITNSLKQFLSQEALQIVQQIQDNPGGDYLYKQLEELCFLEKEQLSKFKSQQRQLRRCKIQLLLIQQGDTPYTSRGRSSRSKFKDLDMTGRFDQTSQFKL